MIGVKNTCCTTVVILFKSPRIRRYSVRRVLSFVGIFRFLALSLGRSPLLGATTGFVGRYGRGACMDQVVLRSHNERKVAMSDSSKVRNHGFGITTY